MIHSQYMTVFSSPKCDDQSLSQLEQASSICSSVLQCTVIKPNYLLFTYIHSFWLHLV